jgi:hemerythrin
MFQWDEKYSLGIKSIDNQHKELFLHLNKLLEAMKQGQANEVIDQVILEVERYAIIHFQKEEFFFKRFNFPSSDEHIKEHQEFTNKVSGLKADLKSGKITMTFELLSFLKEWIDHHILVVDKQYSECFRQNGLQ